MKNNNYLKFYVVLISNLFFFLILSPIVFFINNEVYQTGSDWYILDGFRGDFSSLMEI